MYGYTASMYVCTPRVCLVPADARRGDQIPWDWSYHHVGAWDRT